MKKEILHHLFNSQKDTCSGSFRIPGIRRWSPEFLPAIFEPSRVDKLTDVSRADAIYNLKRMAA